MRGSKLASVAGLVFLGAASVMAQQETVVVSVVELQTPRNGMVRQYEDGRKQKAAWHEQQNDSAPLYVWQVRSGEHTGSYLIGRFGAWADLDKPTVPESADLEEYERAISPYVDSMTTTYYQSIPRASRPASQGGLTKLAEVITFVVLPGHDEDFRRAIDRGTDGANKTHWPVNYEWCSLVSGGRTGTYVLVIPHANWADFEDKPDRKSFRAMLRDAFGQDEAESILKRFDSAIESEINEVIEFRPDLSYLPQR